MRRIQTRTIPGRWIVIAMLAVIVVVVAIAAYELWFGSLKSPRVS
jgi:hypothetical protein